MSWRFVSGILIATTFAALLAGCANGYTGGNCASPIAAVYTEQCNPYLERTPGP
jgi:hypothetical protein